MVLFPPVWPVYLVGLVLALAALARGDAIRLAGRTFFMLIRGTAIGWGGFALWSIIQGHVQLDGVLIVAVAGFLVAITWRPATELAVAAIGILVGLGVVAFTGMIALEPLAVAGAYVAVVAAAGLTAGSIAWTLEVLWSQRVRDG